MNAETLNIKLKLDLGTLMNDVKKVKTQLSGMAGTVKNSIPKISTESKRAKDALGDVTKASNDVKKAIDGIGDEAKDSLSTVTSQSSKMAQALKSIGIAGRDAQSGFNTDGMAESTDGATASLEEMQGTMQDILSLNVFGALSTAAARFLPSTEGLRDAISTYRAEVEKLKPLEALIYNQQRAFDALAEKLLETGASSSDIEELTARSDELRESMEALDKQSKDLKRNLRTAFTDAGIAALKLTAIIVALGAAIAAVALTINAIGISQLGSEIYNNAQRAGMSAQAYQEWTYVMERAGIEADELTEVIKTLTEGQIEVLEGSEDMTAAFQKLGMSASDVAGMGQDQLWNNTIAALQNVENATERTAIAYKIFGEDAAKLTTILNLSNADTQQLINTYNQLNGAMSKELITNSAVLQNSLGNLRVAWGGLRNTLAQAVIPAIISVVNWITRAIVVVNVFLQKFFNLDLTPATDNMASGFTGATGAVEGYESAVGGATKAVEKLKRTTMGFDELNIVSNPNTSAGGGGGGGGGGASGADMGSMLGTGDSIFTEASKQVEEFEKKVSEFMDKWGWAIKAIGTLTALVLGRNLIVKLASLIGLGEKVAAVLSFKGITGAISKFVGWLGTVISLLKEGNSIGAVFGAAFPKLSAAISSASGAVTGFLSAIGGAFGLTGGTAIAAGAAVIVAAITAIISVVVYLKRNWDEVTEAVKKFFAENIEPKLANIKAGLQELIPPAVLDALKKMWQGIKDIVKVIGDWFKSIDWIEKIGDVFEAVGKMIFSSASGLIAGAIQSVIVWIEGLVEQALGFKNIISGVVKAIVSIFKGDLPAAKEAVTQIFNGIKQVLSGWYKSTIGIITNFVSGVGDWFAKLYPKFETVWNKIKKLFSNVGSAIADGVSGAVKAAVNAVLRTVTNKINTFIGWINGAVGVINKIPGVNIGKITKLSVPQLATGGIVTSETLARIGERGKKEAVLPLEQNTGWMDMLADRINSRGGGDRPIHIHVDVDGTELGWAVIKSINDITRQTGGLQLAL